MWQMPSIQCQKGSYFKNFVQHVGTSYNSSPFICAFYAFESPLLCSHCNCEGDVTIIPFAMGTRQGDPLGGTLFVLAHPKALHSIAIHFPSYIFPSIANDT
jgi:hypothetical protein